MTSEICVVCQNPLMYCESEDETETLEIVYSCKFSVRIQGVKVTLLGIMPSGREYWGQMRWNPMISNNKGICYDAQMMGGTHHDPLDTWKGLQDRLDQWLNRPETIGFS